MIRFVRLRTFRRDQRGAASIEFVFLFPLFITVMLMSVETGVYMARQVMLDRSVDLAVRDLRLQTDNAPTFYELKDKICANAMMIDNCGEVIQIEMRPVDLTTWQGLDGPARCRDVQQNIDPYDPEAYKAGEANELMMIQVCALLRPVLPTTPIGLGLQYVDGERYAIVVKTGYVNEPSS